MLAGLCSLGQSSDGIAHLFDRDGLGYIVSRAHADGFHRRFGVISRSDDQYFDSRIARQQLLENAKISYRRGRQIENDKAGFYSGGEPQTVFGVVCRKDFHRFFSKYITEKIEDVRIFVNYEQIERRY